MKLNTLAGQTMLAMSKLATGETKVITQEEYKRAHLQIRASSEVAKYINVELQYDRIAERIARR